MARIPGWTKLKPQQYSKYYPSKHWRGFFDKVWMWIFEMDGKHVMTLAIGRHDPKFGDIDPRQRYLVVLYPISKTPEQQEVATLAEAKKLAIKWMKKVLK